MAEKLHQGLGSFGLESSLTDLLTNIQFAVEYLSTRYSTANWKGIRPPFPALTLLKELIENTLTTFVQKGLHRHLFKQAQDRGLVEDTPKDEHKVFLPDDIVPLNLKKVSGAFGTVYMVASLRDRERVYACKELPLNGQAEDDDEIIGWKLELENLSILDHDHLVKLECSYTIGHSVYSMYLIMSPFATASLKDFMEKPDKYDWWTNKDAAGTIDLVVNWMCCLAAALSYLHDSRMHYRDIKLRIYSIRCVWLKPAER
ncbi:hypothetical protein HDU85_006425 [Gaertneriomyces sp. JEL0708]|nr:hypothetical protein HDU85_006425 [Gaertneriomyces sp. JEL0708]